MNKTLKKTLSIILTILMLVTSVPFALAAGDGVPLTIDVTDKSSVIIGNGRDYFDEDGYIITGTNTEVPIYIYDSCHITFNNMSASGVYIMSDTEENVTVTLDGDNYMYGGFYIYASNLTINGDDDDILKIVSSSSAFTTSGGNPGSLTVNGGKINAVTETTDNYPTVSCFAGFTLNGGEVTASNNNYYVISNKTIINGGTLNVISTSPDIEAIELDVEIAKGALLTVNATYMVIRSINNIIAVNEGEENLLLFARFDKDSDFAPVLDIKAALDGKAYAEIKVDTHEHSLENGKCVCGYECPHESYTDGKCGVCGYECPHESYTDGKCGVCGYECPHESYTDGKCGVCGYECLHESSTDGKCDACGAVGTVITITMNDSYGDGWNGNSIVIKQLVDGAYTEVASATFYDGDSDTFTKLLPAEYIYALSWAAADYADECSFTVAVDGKTVYECADGSALSVGKVFYVMCEHNIENGSCSECGLTCGVDLEHTLTDYTCTVCGKYMYAITHQPTAAEPYVELNNDTDASYQWCTVEGSTVEITDENARPFDPSETGIPAELFSGTVTYDAEVGWSPMMLSDAGWLLYFVADLKAGEVVSVEFSSEFPMVVSLSGLTMDEEVYLTADGNRAGGVVEIDGEYALRVECDIDALTSLPLVEAYFEDKGYTPIEGATEAELASPVIGNEYACEVTFADGTKEMSDSFEYTYTITHQPTSDEPYVELNDDTDASYQWYTVEENTSEITDENAATVSYTWGESSYDKETGWTGVPYEEDYNGQDFFTVELKAGETITVEVTGDFIDGLGLWDYDTENEAWVDSEEDVTSYELTVESEGNYTFYTYVNSGVVTVKAYKTTVDENAIDGETSAELKNPVIGNKHFCEVTFADGTTEMSDAFEVTKLHDCDFSGEWKYDADKHWKECAVSGCGEISEEATHSFTDGKCDCGYTCPHSSYTDGKCDDCGYECTHEGQNGSCQVCGANLGKLVIDVTDGQDVNIGTGYEYYDEDGYIITGTNQDASVLIYEPADLTFRDATFAGFITQDAPENSVFNITLEGTTEITGVVSMYKEHLIFDGDEAAIFKAPSLCASGFVTVNGGNIVLDRVTDINWSTIGCNGGFTINGGTVTASNNYFYVVNRNVTLNGGELNIISTSTDYAAMEATVTMKKGTLLTFNAESGMLRYDSYVGYIGKIVMADGAEENDYFFVRYDTESEFTPVRDINSALDGKTYAEIKIDTHEHSFENSICAVCGYACPHENVTDGKCLDCGAELHICDFSGEWKYDADKHWKECDCGLISEEGTHTGGTATCTEQAKCEHCGASYGEVNAHDWSNKDGVCANGCGEVCPHEKYTDGICDKCGYECTHNYGEGVLTRPTFGTAGYYTYTCTLCGHSYTEPTKGADTTALNDASMKVMEYISKDTLTQEAANEIHNSYLDILKNNGNIFDEFGFVRGDLVEEDQPAINAVTAELEKIIADAEEKIASGEYVKADYTEIDEAIASVDEALENATISEEMADELSDIKSQLEALKENENTSMADAAELLERVKVVAETMADCANGIHSFTKYEEVTAPKCGKTGLEKAVCDYGCGATDEKEIPALTHKDDDGDHLCDYGCGTQISDGAEGETGSPADDCDHLCHKDGILGFLWKIICFFYRLFNIQQYCDCGAIHYDAPVFG
ncbi:MAG: hypothetical protein IJC04_03115 [Oscillospiraceae bacterium]|nr:hypothetical protein [Oscillospiraceae bacterium]